MRESIPHSRDFGRIVDRLHRTLEAAKALNSTLDLTELTRIILKIVRDEVEIDRGTVFVVDRPKKLIRSIVAQEVEREIALPIGTGIAGTVAATGQIVDIPNAYSDARFDSSFDSILGYRTKDIYCMPIVNRVGGIVGVLELLNRRHSLTAEDKEFLSGISVHMGLALENAWLHRQILEKKKIEKELALARDIQHQFYPNLPDSYGGVQISGSSQMCQAVGGDYLGFFNMPDGRFVLMLGDVSGKGIGAALVMTSVHATCRALIRHVHSLERVASILNEMLIETTSPGTFVTLFIMLVDPSQGKLHFIRGGHHPALRVTPSGKVTVLSDGGAPPFGLFAYKNYSREIATVESGSVVVLYSDGIIEAENNREVEFGVENLKELVKSRVGESAAQIHQRIRSVLEDFVGDVPAMDDSTLVVLKF